MQRIFKYLTNQALRSEEESREQELSFLQENSEAVVLDLGCGDGSFTSRVGEKVGSSFLKAIEIVDEDIQKATNQGIEITKSNLNGLLPFNDNSIDVIIVSHVIEHLENTDVLLQEMYRVLKSGGYVVLATPNLAAWYHIVFLVFGKQPSIAEVSDFALVGTWSPRKGNVDRAGPAHRRIFTYDALKELFYHYNYSVEKVSGSGYFPITGKIAKLLSHIDKKHSTNIVIKAKKK